MLICAGCLIPFLVCDQCRYSGFYKGVQSAGAAAAWQIDTHMTPLLTQLIINWVLMTVSFPLLILLVVLAVKDGEPPAMQDAESKGPPAVPAEAGNVKEIEFGKST